MSNEYRNNHYVPVWYQKRFIPSGATHAELYYLDLHPGTFRDGRGTVRTKKAVRRIGSRECFSQLDLYTTNFGGVESRDLEKIFFGQIDTRGREAVEHFSEFDYSSGEKGSALTDLMKFMSTQKLRTPKGLGWLRERTRIQDSSLLLRRMFDLRQLFCAIWTESVWQIADASLSSTKFLISDHPVTVYNRECGPRCQRCRGYNDPEIWLNGTHTLFPLNLNKLLILTNLAWVRNPFQSAVKERPNPHPLRSAVFNVLGVQSERKLTEEEVLQTNFIIKSRAFRYIAAGEKDWLYPERQVSKSEWSRYGNGYLFMPDPRNVRWTTEIIFGHADGTATAFDAYGRRPWERDYKASSDDRAAFERFQGQFARLFGPYHRGRTREFGKLGPERDSDWMHEHYLSFERRNRK